MFVVGLTGGIGAGKTTVAELFKEKNIPIIDADQVAKEITDNDENIIKRIKKHFGETILLPNGALNRSLLRKLIFQDSQQRLWLENLLHPLIKKRMEAALKVIDAPYCIAVIPLLFEVEFYSFIHRTLVVDTPQSKQVERVIKRDQLKREEVEAILKSQASRKNRLIRAHDVITNTKDLAYLQKQVDELHEKYLRLSQEI